MARASIAALGGVLAISISSCGIGAGDVPSAVTLTVTQEFGAHAVRSSGPLKLAGQETVMRMLTRNYTVGTRYGGGFVQSIDGHAGGEEAGQRVDWFFYVNGVEATKGAAATDVHAGDHVWWDRHDWSQAESVPAVVGSFPEPFLNGYGGKRYPVRIECASVAGSACKTVTARLRHAGVPAAIAALGGGSEPEVLRVLVGPWRSVTSDPGAQSLKDGPGTSGVYVRFAPDGSTLALLDPHGQTVRTLSAGAGLVAATRVAEGAPVWVLTGTDEAGVQRAAQAFQTSTLANHFALALAPQGAVPVPVVAP